MSNSAKYEGFTHNIDAFEGVFGQKQNRNHTRITVFTALGPADFFLFPVLKTPTKGKRFATIEEIKEKSKQELLAVAKSAFQMCFEDWKNAGLSNICLR